MSGVKSVRHGATGYNYYGCRCTVCKEGHAEKQREGNAKRKEKLRNGAPIKHGSITTYVNYGCRCKDCHNAAVLYHRERRRIIKENANV